MIQVSKIKICGLTRLCDIDAANEAMPDYVGFVFAESRRQVTAAQALALRERLHERIVPVGVFVNDDASHILALVEQGVIGAIQLHGEEDERYIEKIKTGIRSISETMIIKAVSVSRIGDAQKWENTCADYLLLDNKGGGTGVCFDWRCIGHMRKPYFLAGGLGPGNIEAAINQVNPYAVDVSSGVETDGYKDSEKMKELVRRVRGA